MNPIVRNTLAAIAGVVIGSVVNMGIIMMSGSVIPPPEGADITTVEGLKASIHLFEPKNFIFPFMAHALGTFSGALTAALIAANNKMRLALAIGVLFLIGGITNCFMIPAPAWFMVVDLVGAYLPVAFLAGKWAASRQS